MGIKIQSLKGYPQLNICATFFRRKQKIFMENTSEALNKDIIISFLRDNKDFLLQEYGVTKIGLFGSYAREEQTMDLKYFLEAHFQKKVDIGYLHSLKTFIRHCIEEDLEIA